MNLTVTGHAHGVPVAVRGRWRCNGCGHRLTVNGIAPLESRKLPFWTWPAEIIDRWRATMMLP